MAFRFAVVTSHPIQHYAPIFRELARVPGIAVKAFFFTANGLQPTYDSGFGRTFSWDVPLLDGFDYEVLPDCHAPKKLDFWHVDNPSIAKRLDEFQPHAMWVHGYGYRSCWRAVRWAQGRCATLFFGDSELLRPRPLWRRVVKQVLVRQFFRRCDAFLTIGDNNEKYYAHYGVPQTKMYRGACPIDLGRFRAAIESAERTSRSAIRARFGLAEDAIVVVFSGKMIPLKRPGDLVKAMALLRRRGIRAQAIFVGDGPLRPQVQEEVRAAGLEGIVKFAGFVNQREIPLVLECGDVLAITSERDAHPLAVTESMAVGHAIVASDRVGCVGITDSAQPGVNTLVYPFGDITALTDNLQRVIEDKPLRRRMQEASLRLVQQQDVGGVVVAILRALRSLTPKYVRQWQDVAGDFFTSLP